MDVGGTKKSRVFLKSCMSTFYSEVDHEGFYTQICLGRPW